MSRNYGIMSGPQHLGGASMSRSAGSADTRAGSNVVYLPPSPSAFIAPPVDLPLPRGKFAQAMIDILTVVVWMVFGLLVTAVVGGPIIAVIWMVFFS